MDLVANRVAVVPSAAGLRKQLRVRQGVFDTNLEALFDLDKPADDSEPANISEAMSHGVRLIAVSPETAPPNRFLQKALARGSLVFAIRIGKGSSSWWEVDPGSGATIGLTARGWGGTSGPETAKTTVLTGVNSMRITARYFLTLLCVSQVAIKHVAQSVRAKLAARGAARQGVPEAAGDHAPGGAGTALGVGLCVVGHGLSGIGTFIGGARGAPWSLAGDFVSIVMAFWSVAATYDALVSMLVD